MDSADRQFLAIERQSIERTLELLNEAYASPNPSELEWIAIATLVQNLYTGMENVLRFVLQSRGVKIRDSARWHKDLLASALDGAVISQDVADGLMQFLLFRHVHVHGYAFRIDQARIRPLVEAAPNLVRRFFAEVERLGFNPNNRGEGLDS